MKINIFPIKNPQSKKGTFLNALVGTVYAVFVFYLLWAILNSFAEGAITCDFIDYSRSCGVFEALGAVLLGVTIYFVLGTIFTVGLNIIIPVLVIWMILESIRRRKLTKLVTWASVVGLVLAFMWAGERYSNTLHHNTNGIRYNQSNTESQINNSSKNSGHHMDMMNISSEKDFLLAMIPHHQEAVDTAKQVLAFGATTPEMKALAEGIVAAQEQEIADMKMWYQDWYTTPYVGNGSYKPMMRDLGNLTGSKLDQAFLSDMIMHHMGAIMMANSVYPYIKHSEITKLTTNIKSTQALEIEQMKKLLEQY